MRITGRWLFHVVVALLLSGCASGPLPTPEDFETSPRAFVLEPGPDSASFEVMLSVGDGPPVPFLIDTASTRTVLFPKGAAAAGLSAEGAPTTLVVGLGGSERRPLISLPRLRFGRDVFENLPVVLLEPLAADPELAGLVGLDILKRYALLWRAETKSLIAMPRQAYNPKAFSRWRLVPVEAKPANLPNSRLYFAQSSIVGRRVPVLIDTGSDRSLMNWVTGARSPTLYLIRRRLKRQWELQGAVGRFDPVALARVDSLFVGDAYFSGSDWFVADLGPLDRGPEDIAFPLLILGRDLLEQRDMLLDFAGGQLFLETSPDRPIETRSGNVITIVPR